MESSEVHDESAAQTGEPMHHDAASAEKHKRSRPSRLGSTASALFGLVIVAGSVAAALFPDHEIVRNVTKLGVKPNVAMVGGFGLLLVALVLGKLEALAIRVASMSDAASQLADGAGRSDQTADAVTSRLEPTIITVSQQAQQISEQVASMDSAVQGFASQSGKTAASLDEQRRQHASMTTALDGLGKQLDKGIERLAAAQQQQQQRPSYAAPSAASAPSSDMLTPITKALDDLARDQTSRAAKMHASMRELTESLKGSVGPIEAAAKSAIDQASKQMLESMSKTIESMTKTMETMSKALEARSKVVESKIEGLEEKVSSMQSAASESKDQLAGLGSLQSLTTQLKSQAQSIDAVAKSVAEIRMSMSNGSASGSKNFDATASKLDRLATQLAAALGSPEPPPPARETAKAPKVDEEEQMQMSTGPKESKTMLSAIDRLRRLRTND